jgi:hypothetical protein
MRACRSNLRVSISKFLTQTVGEPPETHRVKRCGIFEVAALLAEGS